MEEAIRLKERLTKEAIWAHEARYSSIHYLVQRMIMQELGHPVEKVILPGKPRDGMSLDENIRKALGIGPRPEMPLEGLEKKIVLPGQRVIEEAPTPDEPKESPPAQKN